ncbi:hypothetical protein [Mangrovibacterium lignilyticum]|uniref:hypothetical protein n=1 Tax=Mangrovibacterium lignilyticum TaxID=2668052 RepID=UPI0013D0C68C|nr:hypothetical protein [Mangrovibacterium lignilyticum]
METRSIKQIRDELKNYPPDQLQALCLRMAKFKKDNKELLTYLLFESEQEADFIQSVKAGIDRGFKDMNRGSGYWIKKSLRKILKDTTQAIRYSGIKTTEIDLLIYFCRKMRTEKITMSTSPVIRNMYVRQVQKIETTVSKLHEDLQFDYQEDLTYLKA